MTLVVLAPSQSHGRAAVRQRCRAGAVAISFTLSGCSLLFVGCHLHAHHSNTSERNGAYWRAERGLALCPHAFEYETERVCDRFDRVFWLGDMNYRINGLRHMVDKLISTNMHEVSFAAVFSRARDLTRASRCPQVLWFNDQLRLAMERGEVFQGYVEGPLFFKPTYKFDKYAAYRLCVQNVISLGLVAGIRTRTTRLR